MNEAPKKIYWSPDERLADENNDNSNEIPYIRADLVNELVEALEELMYARTDKAESMAGAALKKLE